MAVTAFAVHQQQGKAGLTPTGTTAAALTALLCVVTIGTGGAVSGAKPPHAALLAARRIAPFLTLLATAGTYPLLITHA